jgi:hypothetical protein
MLDPFRLVPFDSESIEDLLKYMLNAILKFSD